MKKKAIIIEHQPCHQELIPSWIWALSENGYEVDFYCTPRLPSHRSIADNNTLPFNRLKTLPKTLDEYSIVINNSLYPGQPVTPGSTHSVLHSTSDSYKDIPSSHVVLALGPHLHNQLVGQEIRSIFAPPIYFGDLVKSTARKNKRIVVQGTMEKFRRNYGCVATLTNRFAAKGYLFEFLLVGDGSSAKSLLSWIASQIEEGYRNRVTYQTNLSYSRFFDVIRSADWIMPCVDDTFEHAYFTKKITSSVMMAIGHGIPLVIHQKLADIYGLQNDVECLCYSSETLEMTFLKALTINEETYQGMVRAMRQFRLKWLMELKKVFAQK